MDKIVNLVVTKEELTNKFLQVNSIRNEIIRTVNEINNTAFVLNDIYLIKKNTLKIITFLNSKYKIIFFIV